VLIPCSTGLRAAAAVRHAVITIVTAGTAPATDGPNIDPRTWVAGLYASGGRPYFDAIGHHPYTWPYPPDQNAAVPPASRDPNQWNAMIQTKDIRATMVHNGDAGKQVWATEVGVPSRAEPPTYPASGHQGFVSFDLLATRIEQIFSAWFGMPTPDDPGWVGPLIWYQHRDQSRAPIGANTEGGFGVTDHQGVAKPTAGMTPRAALTDAFTRN
jgi:hypothetical protein